MAALAVVGAVAAAVLWAPTPSEPGAEVRTRPASGGGRDVATEAGHPEARAVLQREAVDGTVVRVVTFRYEAETYARPAHEGWTPPAHCEPSGDLQIGLAGTRQVGTGWAPIFDLDVEAPVVRASGLVGHPTLGPVLYAALAATDEVKRVELVVDGEAVDEVRPESGWAVLAAELPARASAADEELPDAHLVVDGEELPLDTEPVQSGPECLPPPPDLPEGTRPAGEDDAEAVAAIRSVYAAAFSPEERPADLPTLIRDGDQIDEDLRGRIEELGEGHSDIQVEVEDVAFAGDDRAYLQFRLVGAIGWMIGQAELVDGRWLVSGQTFCHLIGISGLECPETMWRSGAGPYVSP